MSVLELGAAVKVTTRQPIEGMQMIGWAKDHWLGRHGLGRSVVSCVLAYLLGVFFVLTIVGLTDARSGSPTLWLLLLIFLTVAGWGLVGLLRSALRLLRSPDASGITKTLSLLAVVAVVGVLAAVFADAPIVLRALRGAS